MTVREIRSADGAAVRTVQRISFPGPGEARLVEQLRTAGDTLLELIASRWGVIVGSVVFSRAHIHHSDGASPVVALGPVAVSPSHRRGGIGALLIETGITELAERGETAIFVLGDPVYYGRFGFEAAPAAAYESPWAGPYLMVRRMGALPPGGQLRYARPFDQFD